MQGKYHYEALQMRVKQNDFYTFDNISSILLYAYIYKNDFDPSYPHENLLAHSNSDCDSYHFGFGAYLQVNLIYILVVTTFDPNVQGNFTLIVSGPKNIALSRISKLCR